MNLPVDFQNRMKDYLGEEWDSFLASFACPEVKSLRVNKGIMPTGEEVKWNPAGYYYDSKGILINKPAEVREADEALSSDQSIHIISPGKHPLHEAGAYYIQEASAMAPVKALSVEAGDRVLDLCAAPGGKSTQIGLDLKGEGILISNEIVSSRAKILSENIERMGIGNALVISEDPRDISSKFSLFFDKILVDAPCSGEGMFRRSDIAVNEWSLDNVKMCAERQRWILDEAYKMLAPGGRLVYSTCTFSKEEDEENALKFIEAHPDMRMLEVELPGVDKGFDGIGYRIWPHKAKGEGHFLCVFAKEGMSGKIPPVLGYEKDLSEKDKSLLKDMYSFLKETIVDLSFMNDRSITKFGDQIYLLPKHCPKLKGLKVMRPGLHLGTILKNRFEPGHALAMFLSKNCSKKECYLSLNNDVIYKYINGETFNISEEMYGFTLGDTSFDVKDYQGWNIIFFGDKSAGWGKLTNGIMKNHYPKGLRKNLKIEK